MNQKIKIYRYYFENKKHPLCIVANNRIEARHKLSLGVTPYLHKSNKPILLGETVAIAIVGKSKMHIDNVSYIWVGFENSPNGWDVEK